MDKHENHDAETVDTEKEQASVHGTWSSRTILINYCKTCKVKYRVIGDWNTDKD